jgi:tetratricopeptide (TPR) repeat protein
MERPKYQLILILLLLNFASSGGRVFAKPTLFNNSLFLLQTTTGNTPSIYRQKLYQAYISGEMEGWKTAMDNMEKQKKNEPGFLLDLINYQYGYVAWCLGNKNHNEAKHYLSLLDKNLEKLKSLSGESAEYHAYTAAAYGFKIGLSTWRAPFFGPKSMNHAELALEKNPRSFQANMEMGNVWNHMPAMFGGSDEKALVYYSKALEIMESKPEEIKRHNWMYLNLLTLVGQMQKEKGDAESARKYFEQALKIEPNFVWVKEELLPSLKTD